MGLLSSAGAPNCKMRLGKPLCDPPSLHCRRIGSLYSTLPSRWKKNLRDGARSFSQSLSLSHSHEVKEGRRSALRTAAAPKLSSTSGPSQPFCKLIQPPSTLSLHVYVHGVLQFALFRTETNLMRRLYSEDGQNTSLHPSWSSNTPCL